MNMRYLKAGFATILSGAALVAWAADPVAVVRYSQGKVLVGQGNQMAAAYEGMPLYNGNRVVVASGGAQIAYSDGCVVTLPDSSLLAVNGSDQCRMGRAQVRATGGFQNSRIGQTGPLTANRTDGAIADLRRPQGAVRVDQGGRELPGRPNMSVQRDDQVITENNSKVIVSFRGCEVEVGSQEQVTVDALRERCKDGVVEKTGDSSSEVAIIKRPQGNVAVDGAAARHDMGVNGGNRIVTGTGSRVIVVFKACEVQVDENENVRIKDLVSKCKGGFWVDAGAGGAGGAGSVIAGGGSVGAGAFLVGGALAVTVGVALRDKDRPDRPASPAR